MTKRKYIEAGPCEGCGKMFMMRSDAMNRWCSRQCFGRTRVFSEETIELIRQQKLGKKQRLSPEVINAKRKQMRLNRRNKKERVPFLAAKNALYTAYKKSAIARNINFELDKEYFFSLTKQPCFYCGVIESGIYKLSTKGCTPYPFNGVDRIDNSSGYVVGNVVACCKTCNYAKRKMSVSEFYDWVNKVHNHIHNRLSIQEYTK